MARLAFDTVREMMACAVDEPAARPGMVTVIQTFGSPLNSNASFDVVTRALDSASLGFHPLSTLQTTRPVKFTPTAPRAWIETPICCLFSEAVGLTHR
jgi:hypothetical protein